MMHEPGHPSAARASGGDTFDETLHGLAWQFIAVLAIGLLAHIGMLLFDRTGNDADTGTSVAGQCRRVWVSNRIGPVDLGTYESDCANARDA